MSFDEFENQARLYVVGALDEHELRAFTAAREHFGERAEEYIQECRKLNAAFALSLRPQAPKVNAKERLMSLIQKTLREKGASKPNNGTPKDDHDLGEAEDDGPHNWAAE